MSGLDWTMTEAAKMMLEYKGEEYVKKEMARMPLGRAAQPREIGLLAVYLASEASDMVTTARISLSMEDSPAQSRAILIGGRWCLRWNTNPVAWRGTALSMRSGSCR